MTANQSGRKNVFINITLKLLLGLSVVLLCSHANFNSLRPYGLSKGMYSILHYKMLLHCIHLTEFLKLYYTDYLIIHLSKYVSYNCSSIEDLCQMCSFVLQSLTLQQDYKETEFSSTLNWKSSAFGLKEHSLQTIQGSQHEVSVAFVTYHERLFTPTERCSTVGRLVHQSSTLPLEEKKNI